MPAPPPLKFDTVFLQIAAQGYHYIDVSQTGPLFEGGLPFERGHSLGECRLWGDICHIYSSTYRAQQKS